MAARGQERADQELTEWFGGRRRWLSVDCRNSVVFSGEISVARLSRVALIGWWSHDSIPCLHYLHVALIIQSIVRDIIKAF